MLQKFCFLQHFLSCQKPQLEFVASIREKKFLRNIFSHFRKDLLSALLGQSRELSFPFQQKETTSFPVVSLALPSAPQKSHKITPDRVVEKLQTLCNLEKFSNFFISKQTNCCFLLSKWLQKCFVVLYSCMLVLITKQNYEN